MTAPTLTAAGHRTGRALRQPGRGGWPGHEATPFG